MPESGSTRWKLLPSEEDEQKMVWHWVPDAEDDLDHLFSRVANRSGSALDHELFHASIIDRFVCRVNAGEQVESWILHSLADSFFKVLMGEDWSAEFQLPGRAPPPVRPWRDQRDLEIFCDVSNAINLDGSGTVDAIQMAADRHAVSFETARAAYYRWNNKPEIADSKNRTKP